MPSMTTRLPPKDMREHPKAGETWINNRRGYEYLIESRPEWSDSPNEHVLEQWVYMRNTKTNKYYVRSLESFMGTNRNGDLRFVKLDKPIALHSVDIRGDLFDGTLNGYQNCATGTAIYPGQGTFWGLTYVALKGAGEAGEFAEKVGKLMRDNGAKPDHSSEWVPPRQKEALILEIGDQLWYLAAKCNELGITLEEAAKRNIEKLRNRQLRGTLGGSGDNR